MGRYFIVTPTTSHASARVPLDEAQVATLYRGRVYIYMPNDKSWVWDSAVQEDYFVASPDTHFEEVPENFALFIALSLRPYSSTIWKIMTDDAGPEGILPLRQVSKKPPTKVEIGRAASHSKDPTPWAGERFEVGNEDRFGANFKRIYQPVIRKLLSTSKRSSVRRGAGGSTSLVELLPGANLSLLPQKGFRPLGRNSIEHQVIMEISKDISLYDIRVREDLAKGKSFSGKSSKTSKLTADSLGRAVDE